MTWWKMWKRFFSLHVCSFPFMTSVFSRSTEDYLQHQEREEFIRTELMNWWKIWNRFSSILVVWYFVITSVHCLKKQCYLYHQAKYYLQITNSWGRGEWTKNRLSFFQKNCFKWKTPNTNIKIFNLAASMHNARWSHTYFFIKYEIHTGTELYWRTTYISLKNKECLISLLNTF